MSHNSSTWGQDLGRASKKHFWLPYIFFLILDVILLTTWYFHWQCHEDVIKWKHFLRYWPFVRGIHRSPVNSPHKGQWRRALMFSFICAWIHSWVNNRKACDLRCHRAHYDITVMWRSSTGTGPGTKMIYIFVLHPSGRQHLMYFQNHVL